MATSKWLQFPSKSGGGDRTKKKANLRTVSKEEFRDLLQTAEGRAQVRIEPIKPSPAQQQLRRIKLDQAKVKVAEAREREEFARTTFLATALQEDDLTAMAVGYWFESWKMAREHIRKAEDALDAIADD